MNINLELRTIISLTLSGFLAWACGDGVPEEPSDTSAPSVHTVKSRITGDVYEGYVHLQERSSFDPSDITGLAAPAAFGELRTRTYTTQLGVQRSVGPRGVFAIHPVTGLTSAAPSPAVLQEFKPFGNSLEEHHARVRHYLVEAGLPEDQLGPLQGGTETSETGAVDDWANREIQLRAYVTLVRRSIVGVPIRPSGAFVKLADSGKAVSETVYWPPVPRAVVDQAAAWKTSLMAAGLESFRAKLPSDIDWTEASAEVVVIHQSPRWTGAPFAVVAYDVWTGDKGYHFAPDGTEMKTIEERN